MNALSALATAIIWRPPGAVPTTLATGVRQACAGAWRAFEIALAGDVLRHRLGRARDRRVKPCVEAVLALVGPPTPMRANALTALRGARSGNRLDGDLDATALVMRCPPADAAVYDAPHVEALRQALAGDPALAAELGDPVLAALLLDIARRLLHHVARRDPELTRWALPHVASAAHERAVCELADLLASPASVEELDRLIALPFALDENVQFTVYRPHAIDPQRWYPLLVFAHLAERRTDDPWLPDPIDEVRRQAEAVLGEHAGAYRQLTEDSRAAIPAEGELVLVPEIEGIEFNPPSRGFLWIEPVHREEFRMRAESRLLGQTARGRLTVYVGHIVIAELALSVRIDPERPTPAPPEPTRARAYRRIFASYSHRDAEIVRQVEQYARALGDEYVRDCIHLRAGEVWNDRLRELIDQADAFQLFWSSAAMHSLFVRQEYEHALALNRPSFVRPTYWEDPLPTAPGLPPPSLQRLHFQKVAIAGPLLSSRAPEPTSTAACARCGKVKKPHYKFCLGCGAELTAAPKPGGDMAMMKTMMADTGAPAGPLAGLGGMPGGPGGVMREPTGGAPQPGSRGSASAVSGFPPPAATGNRRCPSCGSDVPQSFRFCGTCGFRMDAASAPLGIPQPGHGAPVARTRLSMTLLRPDGTVGGSHDLRPGENKLGRSFGAVFENDGYLSPVHAQLDIRGGTAVIRDLDSLNGVFVKMTQEEELSSGQIFRIGQHLLGFELLAAPPQPAADGSEPMGSPNPGYWGKLTVILGRGITGRAFPLLGEGCTLGRERGDINFPDDGYVSGLHARVSLRDGRVFLADLGSSNGTYIKVNGERTVEHESIVQLGEQLFRMNLAVFE
jgi:pSer/pThr/pTyr-binding forkhead associated (FHA) protein